MCGIWSRIALCTSTTRSTHLLSGGDALGDGGMRNGCVREPRLQAKFLKQESRALLANEERGRVRVGAQIVRADAQVDAFKVLSTEHVEATIDDATFLPWLHSASTERMPSRLDVVSDPVVDGFVIFSRVLDVLMDFGLVIGLSRPVPGAHVNSDCEPGGQKLLGRLDVDIAGSGRRSWMEVRVVGGELATEGYSTWAFSRMPSEEAQGRVPSILRATSRVFL